MDDNNKYFYELSDEEKYEAVKKALSEMDKYYWDKIEDGYYVKKCYLDYRDYLEDHNIVDIIKKVKKEGNPNLENARDVLVDEIYDWWSDSIDNEWDDIVNEIIDKLADDFGQDTEEFDESEIYELANEYVVVEPPTDELLDRSEVKVVISLINGDHSFGEFDTYIESEDDIIEKFKGTSVEWLINQQGYTIEQFKQEWETHDTNSKFLKSLITEISEVYDWGGLELTFLSKMSASELFNDIYADSSNGKISSQLTISKDAMCGFLDGWCNGVCGYFIELEKDVVIPAGMLRTEAVYPDAAFTWGPDNICGFTSEAWKGEVKIG